MRILSHPIPNPWIQRGFPDGIQQFGSIPRKILRWEDPIDPTIPKVKFLMGKWGESHFRVGVKGMELSGKRDPTGKKILREMPGRRGSKNSRKKSTEAETLG